MSRILFLSQLVPYPIDAGPKIRIYHVLKQLARRNQVTFLAFSRPDDKLEAVEHLKQFCTAVHTVPLHRTRNRDIVAMAKSIIRNQPFVITRDFLPEMAQLVDRMLETGSFNAVHTDQLWMAQYAIRAKNRPHTIQLVLDEHNACFQVFQRLARGERHPLKRLILEREWRILHGYEAKMCAQFDRVVTVTEEDRSTLYSLSSKNGRKNGKHKQLPATPHPTFKTIPICLDVSSVAPVDPVEGSKNVLHLGTMFWLPNVEGVLWFAREVWPRVKAEVPEASFVIAGKNPPFEIKALAISDNGDQPASQSKAVKVVGYVADPIPYLSDTGAFVVPLLSGGGMRVKILDAWSWGLPVVSTSQGAEGVRYKDGENILIADEAEAFARAVIRLLTEPELAARLRKNGREWVETHYDTQQVYPEWDKVYESSIQ